MLTAYGMFDDAGLQVGIDWKDKDVICRLKKDCFEYLVAHQLMADWQFELIKANAPKTLKISCHSLAEHYAWMYGTEEDSDDAA